MKRTTGPKCAPLSASLGNREQILDLTTEMLDYHRCHTRRKWRPGGQPFLITINPVDVEHILTTNFENYLNGICFARFALDNVCQLYLGLDPAFLDPVLPIVEGCDGVPKLSCDWFLVVLEFPWKINQALNKRNERNLREALLAALAAIEIGLGVIRKRREELARASRRDENIAKAGLLSSLMNLDGTSGAHGTRTSEREQTEGLGTEVQEK